ncbi:SUMF1/EgtB/PvdO family nonheme iron enzyme [Myxococcota bacterium]|nr:SUMF1/EgtB/PvdO family nonheme iron enzyme [Myxococcota bacterium]
MQRTIISAISLCLTLVLFCACDAKTKNVDSCGDGFLDPGEQCDSNVGELSCQSLGYYNALGVLRCTPDCQFNVDSCGGRCGDELVQGSDGETCDGGNLNGQTCQSLGYTGGTLACGEGCDFDVSGCAGRCGNGVIDTDEGEICDGSDLSGETCETHGYHGGELVCLADCSGYNLDNCVTVGQCGDGIIQEAFGEACDGMNLGEASCANEGFYEGFIECGLDCQLDLSSCEMRCGDGIIQVGHGEVCDGSELSGETCLSLGYYGGELSCTADCGSLDDSDCLAVGRCGDGIIQIAQSEECDGADLGGASCPALGYSLASGSLVCDDGCRFDLGACLPIGTNPDLVSLSLSVGRLSPAFSNSITSYVVTLPQANLNLTLTAVPADPIASVVIDPPQPISLVMGLNPVTVTVTAENGVQKVYSVGITRTTSQDYESPAIGTLRHVPAGTFQRDATATNLSAVSAFRMSQYEITRAQWVAVTGWADPSDVTYSGGMNHPVQRISWYDAIAFCNKLSILEGLTPVYEVNGVDFSSLTYEDIPSADDPDWNAVTANWSAEGYRLPTEMEWMWAAMGADQANPGAINTTGYTKAFSGSDGFNQIGDYAVFGYYSPSDVGRTTTSQSDPVGSKLPNDLSIHDLSGNVWEWTWDWNGLYPVEMVTDYHGPVSGTIRLKRGGSWDVASTSCTVAVRNYNQPRYRNATIGLRVIRP